MPLFSTVAEIRKFCKWSKIRFIFNFLAHPVETPGPTWMLFHGAQISQGFYREGQKATYAACKPLFLAVAET